MEGGRRPWIDRRILMLERVGAGTVFGDPDFVRASGGVNTASIQIAKLVGATVFVVGSNMEKLILAESLGADYLIDRSQEADWSRAIYMMTDKRGVDVVVDNVGSTFPMSFRAAAKGGRILASFCSD